jgi:hypothetical protein
MRHTPRDPAKGQSRPVTIGRIYRAVKSKPLPDAVSTLAGSAVCEDLGNR